MPGSSTMVGPQFGILNASTAVSRMNFIQRVLYTAIPYPAVTNVQGATGTSINLSSYLANAGNVATLVQQFNTNLTHGSMTAAEIAAVTTAVNAFPANDPTLAQDRTVTAAYLVLNSPRYQITR
jgi:hypothetical protein